MLTTVAACVANTSLTQGIIIKLGLHININQKDLRFLCDTLKHNLKFPSTSALKSIDKFNS